MERNHMGLHLENEVARLVVKTPTIIFNNSVYFIYLATFLRKFYWISPSTDLRSLFVFSCLVL